MAHRWHHVFSITLWGGYHFISITSIRAPRGQNWGGLPTSLYCLLLCSSSDVPQVRNTSVYHFVSSVMQLCRCLSSIFCPHATLSLKDAELGTSNRSSPKIVEEPQEPASPEAMESIQVTEVTHPCLGPWGGCGGCL